MKIDLIFQYIRNSKALQRKMRRLLTEEETVARLAAKSGAGVLQVKTILKEFEALFFRQTAKPQGISRSPRTFEGIRLERKKQHYRPKFITQKAIVDRLRGTKLVMERQHYRPKSVTQEPIVDRLVVKSGGTNKQVKAILEELVKLLGVQGQIRNTTPVSNRIKVPYHIAGNQPGTSSVTTPAKAELKREKLTLQKGILPSSTASAKTELIGEKDFPLPNTFKPPKIEQIEDTKLDEVFRRSTNYKKLSKIPRCSNIIKVEGSFVYPEKLDVFFHENQQQLYAEWSFSLKLVDDVSNFSLDHLGIMTFYSSGTLISLPAEIVAEENELKVIVPGQWLLFDPLFLMKRDRRKRKEQLLQAGFYAFAVNFKLIKLSSFSLMSSRMKESV